MHHIGLYMAKGRGAKVVYEVSIGPIKEPWSIAKDKRFL